MWGKKDEQGRKTTLWRMPCRPILLDEALGTTLSGFSQKKGEQQ